jgi:iron uptake system component EfeO
MRAFCFVLTLSLFGCSGSESPAQKTDADFKREITAQMHASLLVDIDGLIRASNELQAAAPAPKGRGWNDSDAAAIDSMQRAWLSARRSYELVEGALAPIFPDLDRSLDERYEAFLESLVGKGDDNLFDDQGVTGMHAAERVIFLKTTPANVVTFEQSLPGYKAAAWPATEAEAADFKNKLLRKIITDAQAIRAGWEPAKIDIGSAWQGLVGLMNELKEKVDKASEGSEESRYAQRTMSDIRWNLEGTRKIHALFAPWLRSKAGGGAIDDRIVAGFAALQTSFAAVSGDAIPAPPATWSAEKPAEADLATPFGKLWSAVHAAVDPAKKGSIVDEMNQASILFGFPVFTPE